MLEKFLFAHGEREFFVAVAALEHLVAFLHGGIIIIFLFLIVSTRFIFFIFGQTSGPVGRSVFFALLLCGPIAIFVLFFFSRVRIAITSRSRLLQRMTQDRSLTGASLPHHMQQAC